MQLRFSIGRKLFVMVLAIALAIIALVLVATGASLSAGFKEYVTSVELKRFDRMVTRLETVWQEGGQSWDKARETDNMRELVLPRLVQRQMDRRDRRLRRFERGRPGFPAFGQPFDLDQNGPANPPTWGQDGPEAGALDQPNPPPPRQEGGNPRPPPPPPPPEDPAGMVDRVALLDAKGRFIIGNRNAISSHARRAISLDGQLIGYLAMEPPRRLTEEADIAFLQSQQRTLYLVAVAAVLASVLAASLMARHLRQPITQLAAASRKVAHGAYDTRIAINRRDELGDLARDFNNLAAAIERQEASRRRFIADASHELRTPLAVLRAEVEAILDGVRQPTPQAIGGIHEGVMRMGRLVDELYELARADLGAMSYDMREVNPIRLLGDTLDRFEARFANAGLHIEKDIEIGGPLVMQADGDRLVQVFTNLAENSARYTDAGGKLRVTARMDGKHVLIRFEDTSPGVPEAHLMRLFDRFHRVDEARDRNSGGSGLGLAIVKAIIDAHNGKVRAGTSDLGGLRLDIRLPLSA